MDGSNDDGEVSEESDEDNIDDLKYDSSGEENSTESLDDDEENESERDCEIEVTETSSKVTSSGGETTRFHDQKYIVPTPNVFFAFMLGSCFL